MILSEACRVGDYDGHGHDNHDLESGRKLNGSSSRYRKQEACARDMGRDTALATRVDKSSLLRRCACRTAVAIAGSSVLASEARGQMLCQFGPGTGRNTPS